MLEIKEIHQLKIDSLAFGGDGVGRLEDGRVVFVPFSAPGDLLEVEVVSNRKSFLRAKIVRILQASPSRCEAPCQHFTRCGGCSYQHIDYELEFAAKQQQLKDLLQRMAGIKEEIELDSAFPAPELYGYRNKLKLAPSEAVRDDHGVHMNYGYFFKEEEDFFTVTECPLAMPIINRNLRRAVQSPWGWQNAKKEVPAHLTMRADARETCQFYFGRAPANVSWLREMIFDTEVSVPLGSFWQVNPKVAEKLFLTISSWAEELDADFLIDSYSGVGTFAMAIQRNFKERILIENDRQALDAAEFNLKQLKLKHRIIKEKTESALAKVLRKLPANKTLLVLDPPRSGCQEKVIQTIYKFKPAHLFYISCNPSTLARDLKKLLKNNLYKVDKVAFFDMFPRTAHFETAIKLKLGNRE